MVSQIWRAMLFLARNSVCVFAPHFPNNRMVLTAMQQKWNGRESVVSLRFYNSCVTNSSRALGPSPPSPERAKEEPA